MPEPVSKGIKLSEFALMSEKERERRVGDLFQAALYPTQEQVEEQKCQIEAEIQAYELQHGMTSSQMRQRLASGEIKETASICSWLMLLKIQDRVKTNAQNRPPATPQN